MNNRTEAHLKTLVNRCIEVAMARHPRGSSAAIWDARESLHLLCKGEGIKLFWSHPRKGHMRTDDDVFSVEIPAEYAPGEA